jgi:hypothetical protein
MDMQAYQDWVVIPHTTPQLASDPMVGVANAILIEWKIVDRRKWAVFRKGI